ncbi:MAG TPA: leucyl/phenylalanyl-tRNA--protein transferase [Woeseiaceae bacterium]|nr:leucyl/phenylalanyl-tRNA--protein transferase [Woeseiaceae bacterium]
MTNTRVKWLSADDPPDSFPPVNAALREPNGLLACGGDLSPARLLTAYRQGIFPWSIDDEPLLWWSPDPRCVFLPGDFSVARRLRREIRRSNAEIRINTAFPEVIRACAGPRRFEQGTWITAEMVAAYGKLHEAGWAHSIEVWQDDELCGGLYGLAIGKAFFGESMFSARPNASKMAMLYIANRMSLGETEMLDCQVVSGHLLSLGARTLPRAAFSALLGRLCDPAILAPQWPPTVLPCAELLLE